MKALHDYIVTTDNRYNNAVDVEGKELIVNTEITERDAEFVNRIATVIATPASKESAIQVGDDVIIHHNVFRRWYDMRRNEKNTGSFIKENQYVVSEDQVFAYKRDGEWKATLRYCFVEPIVDDSMFKDKRYKHLKGVLRFTDDYLDSLGIKPGTIVGFTPDSEYEFTIDDKLLYRIYSTHLTIDYGLQERKTTNNSLEQESIASA